MGHHLLSVKAFFVAFGDAQALIIIFENGFNAAATQVIEVDVSQQAVQRLSQLVAGEARQMTSGADREGGDEDPNAPLAIFLAGADGNAFDRTAVFGSRAGHPADLSTGMAGIIVPSGDTVSQSSGSFAGCTLW